MNEDARPVGADLSASGTSTTYPDKFVITHHHTYLRIGAINRPLLKLARPFSRPALDYNLFFCVELYGVTSLGMHVAEEAFFPSREREEGHWRGHANVDADIPRLRFITELSCRGTAAREQASHVAVGGSVHQVNRLINCLHMHQAEYRPKDLDTGDLTMRIYIVQDCRANEVAPLVARDRCIASIDEYPGSLTHAFADQGLDALLALGGDYRPHLDLLVQPVTDLTCRCCISDMLLEGRASLANRDRDRCRQAALSGAAKGRVGNNAGGHLHIGIGQDDNRVLSPTRALGALPVGCRPAIDVLCHRR